MATVEGQVSFFCFPCPKAGAGHTSPQKTEMYGKEQSDEVGGGVRGGVFTHLE